MSRTHTINEMYDIATAFITDRKTTVNVSSTENGTTYTFIRRGLAEYPYQLMIYAPKGAPERLKLKGSYTFRKNPLTQKLNMRWNQPYRTDKKQGEITIQRGTGINFMDGRTIAHAETKHNVGRALDKKQCDIVRFGTRMLSPKFFELIEMANKRAFSKIETSDNTTQMFNLLYRIKNENQK
ncbi:MAG: hypothetical protein IJE82_01465 [Alphaproteobacteria bacterium]|nr:hypothetical protein [Alphaproteobacteria bacterium]